MQKPGGSAWEANVTTNDFRVSLGARGKSKYWKNPGPEVLEVPGLHSSSIN